MLLGEHQEAVEYDLLTHGFRLEWLGTDRLSWHDLWILVRQAPATAAVVRAVQGEAATWTTTDYLLALVVDVLNTANWLASKPGSRRPKPIPRPGDAPEATQVTIPDSMTFDELEQWLGWSVTDAIPVNVDAP